MSISRRTFGLRGAAGIAALTALAGCSVFTDTNGTVTVNLANAQAEATTIYQALNAEFTAIKATLSSTVVSTITKYLGDLNTAVSAFVSLPSTSSYTASVASVLKIVAEILPLVTPYLGTATIVAIEAGEALIAGLTAGVSNVKAPTTLSIGASGKVVQGPIPIPVS